MWTCPKCGAKVDPSFDVCWKCGTGADGVEDPTFVRADDAPPIEDEPVVPALETEPAAAEEVAAPPVGELVVCYQASSLMEARFLADQLRDAGIPAVADTHDIQDNLGPLTGNPHVYCHAADLPRARAWLEAYDERRRAEHGTN
jgi:hypothetical protein